MAETADSNSTTVSPPNQEPEDSTTLPTMSDKTTEESSKDTDLKKESPEEKKPGAISLRIWPPTQKTRNGVISRLIETLTTESVLSKRYGTLDSDEAASVAKSIEYEAYGVASKVDSSDDDDGIKILEIYSREISKRMLETMKIRSTASGGNGTESVKESVKKESEVSKDCEAPESEKAEA